MLTVTQQRTIAIFAFAALMWIFEIVPNWVTSLMVIVISLLTISTKSISFCMNTGDASQFVPMKELMRAFLAYVFASLPDTDKKGKIGIALAIPIAANIGGIGTPIDTPPNAIAASTGLVETKDMAKVGIIVGAVGLVLGFFWVTKFFPFPLG